MTEPVGQAGVQPEPDRYVELNPVAYALFQEFLQAKEATAKWDERRRALAQELIGSMGDANKATVNGKHVLTRVVAVVNRFDTARFKVAMPDLYRDFCVATHQVPYLRLPGDKVGR